MNKAIKSILVLIAIGLTAGVCTATEESDITRGRLPCLRLRSRTGFSDGATDRLRALVWHPTAQILAAAGGPCTSSEELALYDVYGDSTGAYMDGNAGGLVFGGGYQINSIAWSGDGTYIALGGAGVSTNQLRIYSYVIPSNLFTSIFSLTWGASGSAINSVAWHPSGKYLAIGGNGQTNGYEVIVYSLDFTTPLMTAVAAVNLGPAALVHALSWNVDGTYLAVGCMGESTGKAALQTYKFSSNATGSSVYALTQISKADFGGSTAYVRALAWSPDNAYIVAGGYSGGTADDNEVKLYSAASGVLTPIATGNIDFGQTALGAYVCAFAWDPQQRYLIVGGYLGNTGLTKPHEFNMYLFDGAKFTPKPGSQHVFGTNAASYVSALAWQSTRKYVAVGGYLPANSNELWLMEFMTT